MPVQSMQQIAEHSLFKAALPLICAALIGSIAWIFVTVMDLDKVLHRIEESEIPQINADIAKGYEKIEELEFLESLVFLFFDDSSELSFGDDHLIFGRPSYHLQVR